MALVINPTHAEIFARVVQRAGAAGLLRRAFLSEAEAREWLARAVQAVSGNRQWWAARRGALAESAGRDPDVHGAVVPRGNLAPAGRPCDSAPSVPSDMPARPAACQDAQSSVCGARFSYQWLMRAPSQCSAMCAVSRTDVKARGRNTPAHSPPAWRTLW